MCLWLIPQLFVTNGHHHMSDLADQFKTEVEAFQLLVPLLKVITIKKEVVLLPLTCENVNSHMQIHQTKLP